MGRVSTREASVAVVVSGYALLVLCFLGADWSEADNPMAAAILVAMVLSTVSGPTYGGYALGTSFVWAIFAALVLGPGPAAALVVLTEIISFCIDRIRPFALLNNGMSLAVPTYGAGLVYGSPGISDSDLDTGVLFGVALIAVTAYTSSFLLVAVLSAWHDNQSAQEVVRTMAFAFGVMVFSLPILVGAVAIYVAAGSGGAILFIFSLLGLNQATVFLVQSRQRAAQIAELAASRQRLVAQAMQAEEHERRRLAERLHDDAIQNLVVAAQELEEAEPEARGRAQEAVERAITDLREAVFDLHPVVLTQAGLRAALEEVVERHTRRGGAAVALTVDQGAEGADDPLLFSMARELLTNAVKHSHASRVQLTVRRCGEDIELEVVDDGIGIPAGRLESAVRKGHIGLASMRERVEVLGGSLEIDSREEEGTRVKAVVLANASLADPEPEPELGKVRARWLRRIRSRAAT